MENTAVEKTKLETMEEKVLPVVEETMLMKINETYEERIKGEESKTGKRVPKPIKPKTKEEVTEVNNNRHMEKINTKDISEQQNEGLMTAIQKQRRRRSVRKILQTFGAQRKDICQKPLKEATKEEGIAMILRWILDELPNKESVLIKLRDEEGDAFELRIRKYRGCIYAKEIRQRRNAKKIISMAEESDI